MAYLLRSTMTMHPVVKGYKKFCIAAASEKNSYDSAGIYDLEMCHQQIPFFIVHVCDLKQNTPIHPHVSNISTKLLLTGIPGNTHIIIMVSMTECAWEFRDFSFWDTLTRLLKLEVVCSECAV